MTPIVSMNFGVLDSQSPQAIVPEIMEIMENMGFTNSFHGNMRMFSQRGFAKNMVFQCL